jgi:methanogenic corrinoid protein MtbC1
MSIDPQVFARTAGLFAQKRRMLAPDVVEGFAREIVARVAEVVTARGRFDGSRIDPDSVVAFCDLLLDPDQPRRALAFIAARRAEGMTMPEVYLGYIGGAARLLGERWERDEFTPLDVTIGAGTLYALMRALHATAEIRPSLDHRRAALFATVPGEHHGIGITAAAHIFREAGWDIDLQLGLDQAALVERAARTRPTIIGLSLSTRDRLPALAKAVVALRIQVPGAMIGVAPGGDLTGDEVASLLDVDMIFGDALSALAQLDLLVGARDRS